MVQVVDCGGWECDEAFATVLVVMLVVGVVVVVFKWVESCICEERVVDEGMGVAEMGGGREGR